LVKWLIAAAGLDRPGIVAEVTRALLDAGANLEDTSMTRLEDHFAMLLIVTTPHDLTGARMEELLAPARQRFALQLSVHPVDAREVAGPRGARWLVTVSGPDQTGIVHQVTGLLAGRAINVGSLSSRRLPGDDGRPVFLMSIEAEVPEAAAADLAGALAALAQREGLAIHAEPMDEFRL